MAAGTNAAQRSSPDDRVDMGPLSGAIGYLIRRAQLAIFEDFITVLDNVGLRPASFSALVIIGRNPGLNQSEVSAALGIQRTNFVTMVDDFERRGLAKRMPFGKDRRSHALQLTDQGRELLNRALKLQKDHETRLSRSLGPGGREQLLSLLGSILADKDNRKGGR